MINFDFCIYFPAISMAAKKYEAFEAKKASDPSLVAGIDAKITGISYATSLTSFEVKMSKIFSSFHFNFQDGNQNKNKAWSRSCDLRSVRLSELLIGL